VSVTDKQQLSSDASAEMQNPGRHDCGKHSVRRETPTQQRHASTRLKPPSKTPLTRRRTAAAGTHAARPQICMHHAD
jgi:hypothetical protein